MERKAQPGLYFSTFHQMENGSVTLCMFSSENPWYCPVFSLASEYDAGLFQESRQRPVAKSSTREWGRLGFGKCTRQMVGSSEAFIYLRCQAWYFKVTHAIERIINHLRFIQVVGTGSICWIAVQFLELY